MPAKPKMIVERGRGERESGRGLVPAAGSQDEPYNAYLNELDPNGSSQRSNEFKFALAASNDIRFREFLKRLTEPRHKRHSLATIARTCDISLPQFHEFWQSSQKNIALARAQGALPQLMSDLVEDAKTRDVVCSRCDGMGALEVDPDKPLRVCPQCKGIGTQREVGNTHARDKLLEATGMVKKGGGAAVQITQNFGGMAIESAVDTLNQISFSVGDEDGETVDVKAFDPEVH